GGGVAERGGEARIAREGLSRRSSYRATMLYTEGVSYLLEEDPHRADPVLAHAVDVSVHVGAPPLTGLILAQRCSVAAQLNSWSEVTSLAQRAVGIVQAGRLDDYWSSAIVYAWAARAALHQGNIPQGRLYLGRASRLRPLLTYALPVVSVQALLEMAHCYIMLTAPAGAATVLMQAHDILQQRPDLGVLPRRAAELRSKLATLKAGAVGPSALTAAELRVLPLLPTHLQHSEIAAELFLSPLTIKTHTKSIYRKLGASSRGPAVARAPELGLLEGGERDGPQPSARCNGARRADVYMGQTIRSQEAPWLHRAERISANLSCIIRMDESCSAARVVSASSRAGARWRGAAGYRGARGCRARG